ncbi:DNA repair protein xrcc3 [Aphanomyces cochlioides]|nr:DNA repair protein xrcc3 [Aphanomyces cochlioides]
MDAPTAWDLTEQNNDEYLSTGCDAVDELLRGGFPVGMVSEVCGAAGSGKTQMCLQLLLRAQLDIQESGLNASSCYMYSDGLSPLKRLGELASHSQTPVSLNRIFLEAATDPDQFVHVLKSRLPSLMQLHGVRLVVIDSIAAIFRGQSVEKASEAGDRTRVMFDVVNCMRILANQYRAVFIVVNQMSANLQNDNVPALGLAWSSCINQRFLVRKTPRSPSQRTFHVVFSPYLPSNSTAIFEITSTRLE